MRNIGWRLYTLFAIVFFVALLISAPASLLSYVVESASKGQFILANASGTVWQGSALPAVRQRSGNIMALEKLHWDIQLSPLLTGKLVIRMDWDNVEQLQPMEATISYNKIELSNALLPLNAEMMGEIAPLLKPVQLSGQMRISSQLFTVTRQGLNGTAVAEWTNAGSVLSSIKPLGHYRINLAGSGTRLDITLMTITGILLLEGKGSVELNQGLRFQGTARASAQSKGALDELLNNFGPESSPGVHSLNLMN